MKRLTYHYDYNPQPPYIFGGYLACNAGSLIWVVFFINYTFTVSIKFR